MASGLLQLVLTYVCTCVCSAVSNFLVNSADRIIRVFDIDSIVKGKDKEEIEPLQKLQDLVNRWVWPFSVLLTRSGICLVMSPLLPPFFFPCISFPLCWFLPFPFLSPFFFVSLRTQWKKCMFSGDAEFIVAGSHRQHELYIWDKATGSLVKMLTGQKGETLLDIAVSPCFYTCTYCTCVCQYAFIPVHMYVSMLLYLYICMAVCFYTSTYCTYACQYAFILVHTVHMYDSMLLYLYICMTVCFYTCTYCTYV